MRSAARLSLAELLLAFVGLGAGYAALRFASETLVHVLLFATGLSLTAAAATALFGRGAPRVFSAGLVIGALAFGGMLGLTATQEKVELLPVEWFTPIRDQFRTVRWERPETGDEKYLRHLGDRTYLDDGEIVPADDLVAAGWEYGGYYPDYDAYATVIYFVALWLFAYVGTIFTRIAYACGAGREALAADASATELPD